MDVTALAAQIRIDLQSGASMSDMLRAVRQYVKDADRFDTSTVVAGPPLSTGDVRWDALIAGVTEDITYRHGLRVPDWVSPVALDEWWFVTSVPRLRPTAFVETPVALARRGVFIRRATLVNV